MSRVSWEIYFSLIVVNSIRLTVNYNEYKRRNRTVKSVETNQ